MPRFPRRHLLLALLVVLPLAACGGDDDPSAGPTADDTVVSTTSTTDPDPTTSTATADPTPEQEVEAAYLEIVRSYYERLQDPDPDDPSISEAHTGASLAQVTNHNQEMLAAGQRERFTERGVPTPDVRNVTLEGDAIARIDNCYVDDVIVYVAATGAVVDDSASSLLVESVLVLEDGRWKLSEQLVIETTPGAEGCSV